jgi:hypothetical protein
VTVPFALTVNTFIKNVGADAGFAAIIGLALLVLLYFAQMRETATLRDRLEEAAGRVTQLENRLAHLVRAQTSAAARPTQPGVAPRPIVPLRPMGSAVATLRQHPGNAVAAGVQPRPVPVLPGPPSGVAAQALGSATKLIPTPAVAVPAVVPAPGAAPAPVPAPNPVPVPAPATAAAAAPAAVATATAAATAVAAAPTVSDDTMLIGSPPVSGSGNGHSADAPPAIGAPDEDPDAAGIESDSAPAPAGPPPRVHIGRTRGQGAPRRTVALPPSKGSRRSPIVLRIVLGLVAVAVLAGAVAGLVSATGGANQRPGARTRHRTHRQVRHHPAAAFNPADVNVAVLNGTSTNGLASDIANAITSHGYKQTVQPANAAVQTQTNSVVGYLRGQQPAAAAIAKILKLPDSAVQPVAQSAIIACVDSASTSGTNTTSSCPADVIVTVGADLESAATGTTT